MPSYYTTDRSQSKVNRRNHSARTQMVLFYPHKFNSEFHYFFGWFWRIFLFPQVTGAGGGGPGLPLHPQASPSPSPSPWPLRPPGDTTEPAGLGRRPIATVWPRDCFSYGTSHHRELGGNDRFEASTIAPELRV